MHFLHFCPFAIVVLYILHSTFRRRRRLPLPPGPRGYPIIGNFFDFPSSEAWVTFTSWKHKYGDVVHVSLFGDNVIVLNSMDAMHALMDKRAAIYSNRPRNVMGNELIGWEHTLTSSSGERHRKLRTLAQRYFVHNAQQYQKIQIDQAQLLVKRLIASPHNLTKHLKHHAVSIVMRIAYGYRPADEQDPFLAVIEKAELFSFLGVFMVDIFPILKYWPSWLPGGGFQRLAGEGRTAVQDKRDVPFEHVKSLMASGIAEPCFVSVLLGEIDELHDSKEREVLIRDAASTMYGAASHSMASSTKTFFLAMMLYPDIQRRAQEEIDRVIGRDRLPTFEDRDTLPYIEAMIVEILRWNAVTPAGIPHCTARSDHYQGYFIPAGATVIGNMWAVLRDPSYFPDPERFDPSRYLSEEGKMLKGIVDIGFGWGKRVCPGKQLAEASIFITIATCLATMIVSAPYDERGRECEPEVNWSTSMVRQPLPFECTISCRSEQRMKLLADM